MSTAMRVRLEGEKSGVLKLYDRRFSSLRTIDLIPPWNSEREETFRQYVQSAAAENFGLYPNRDEDDGPDEDDWTDAQQEAFICEICLRLQAAEREAYIALHDLQGISIPYFCGTVSLRTHPVVDPKCAPFFDISGILLEDCVGFTLEKLADNVSAEFWQGICDDAVSVVISVGDRGVLNQDVRLQNIIVRENPSNSDTTHSVVMVDFAQSRLRRPNESDEEPEWAKAKNDKDEEGAVGV